MMEVMVRRGLLPDGFYNFATAGLYPIEIAWFNGDWTNDAGDHGGANLNILLDGAPVTGDILYGAGDVGAAAISISSLRLKREMLAWLDVTGPVNPRDSIR